MTINLQKASKEKKLPSLKSIRHWIETALSIASNNHQQSEITIRIVDEPESADLNFRYRQKKYPTNVLSFSFNPVTPNALLGDIIICAPITIKEAQEQHKTIEAHFAHLIIHGVLHLLGYDHENAKDAKKMETLEIKILAALGFANPY